MMCIYYDFETTGLNPFSEKIIEYCFMKHSGESITSLVNPCNQIDSNIERITTITNQMLSNSPTITEKKNEITTFLNICTNESNDLFLIAHNNANFDRFFFKNIYKNEILKNVISKPVTVDNINSVYRTNLFYIDTIHLAKYIFRNKKRYNLKVLCQICNIEPGKHRALSDTIAVKKLYESLVKTLSLLIEIDYNTLIQDPSIVYNIIY